MTSYNLLNLIVVSQIVISYSKCWIMGNGDANEQTVHNNAKKFIFCKSWMVPCDSFNIIPLLDISEEF